ncbi:non-ribosomal peptide synthetase [Saccharomonospora piscinae]|uniref:non-ribosomal peptide synthetase n=1 Tax=Saccharomonospora piscinae TaxID=687388 RepID=UPI0004649023|nr:non-ribosomal peptide synthetase [Saccharomonospora piscinae]
MKAKNIEDVYDLTPLQHGLLFHCLQAPSAGYYLEQMYFTMRGELRTEVVRAAWDVIIGRHPGLRTAFSWEDINRPVQIVQRQATLPLDEVDLRGLDEQERERRFTEYLLDERRQGFDLETAPLFRLTVFRLDADTYRLAWRFSHLVMDGWSFGLIMGDFVTLYKAIYHGREVRLPAANSTRDYVGWWREQDAAALDHYWAEQLDGYRPPPPLDLGDRFDGSAETVTHGYAECDLGQLAEPLQELARERRLTLNTLVQGAWTLVLSRCYGVDDVVVGATMSHRPSEVPGIESVVGPLITTLPVRARLDPGQAAVDWLRDLQNQIIDVRKHAGAPLPHIRAVSEVPNSEELFETIVSYENVPIPDISFAEENLELLGYHVDGRPQYPMSLIALPGDDMPMRVIYERRRFSATTAQRMLDRLRTTLAALIAAPETPIGRLDVVGERERRDILTRLRRTGRVPTGRNLPQVVREHADRTPDKIAVTGDDGSLTYRELVRYADRVAAALQSHGVEPGTRVAVCADRSARFVAGVLGVLTAGAAYVPLGPTDPPGRHALVLADSSAAAVLADTRFVAGLRAAAGEHAPAIVALDGDLADARPRAVEIDADDIAYVMYTSGSTGRPKGVLVTHHNVLRLAAAARQEFGLGADDVWSMFFSPAFDGASWEMWGALTHGARLVVAAYWVTRSPADFLELLVRERVTVCTQSPSAFGQLLPADAEHRPELALRLVVLGGEKVDPRSLRDWFDWRGDTIQVVNAYGPTEATVWVCAHRLRAAESRDPQARALIGQPLVDTSIHLLDQHGHLAPHGAPGEMLLCGPGVAAGYLGDTERTARRFGIDPHPAGDTPGRCYASGDLARLTAEGELAFIGRADGQVKVRGFRVELGEVEDTLRGDDRVRAAVATVAGGGSAGERLLAFVVCAGEPGDESAFGEELKRRCADALPEHMVPVTVSVLDRLPVRANGKVDHQALPAAGPSRGGSDYVAPRTPTEQRIAEVLGELLDVPRVGAEDNLVDLGLHSLVATRAVNEIRGIWRVNVPLRRLYESPTVASLATIVDGGGAVREGPDRPGTVDLARETELDDDLVPHREWEWVGDPQDVFVTGVTGFPGARLVVELLRTTDAEVHCLVRAGSEEEGRERLVEHLRSLGWWDEAFAKRLHPVPGDLSQPYLGLGEERFARYGQRCTELYHFGAHVNFLHPYRRLRSTNVQGTKEMIRLACTGRTSVLHHISGVGVFPARAAAEGEYRGVEVDLDAAAPALPNGYTETKWVAERLVTEARDRGLPVVVHRLGRVSGDSATGAWLAHSDALAELLRASAALKVLPNFDGVLDMVPVDYVGAAIAAIARRREAIGGVFHLVNPRPLRFPDLQAGFELAGYETDSAKMTDWYARLLAHSSQAVDEDWTVAITLLSEWTQHASHRLRDPRFESTRTRELLGDEVSCPPVDGPVLRRYLEHLEEIGFIGEQGKEADSWQQARAAGS